MANVLLSCQNLSKAYGTHPLFEGLSFGLYEGERTGLIGPNGAGKSTLIKVLGGVETPDEGSVIMRKGTRLAYLPQIEDFEKLPEGTAVRTVLEQALDGLGLESYEIDLKVETLLEDSGFKDFDQDVNSLSGGWRKRLAILSQVIKEPDFLLLDEPTNHLDLGGVLWLEKLLKGVQFSFLVITHDRAFLEQVATRILELNKRYEGGYFSAPGNYSTFLEKRGELFIAQQNKESAVANTVRREIEWLRRGPKARSTKQQARIGRAGEMIEELGDLKYRNAQGKGVDIAFSGSERETKRLAEFFHVEMHRGGKKLFGPLDLLLGPGEKLGLLGENGSGKSTLLKLLSGELEPVSGNVKRVPGLKIEIFDQHREKLDLGQTLRYALVGSAGEHVQYMDKPVHVGGWAKRFLFTNDQLDMKLSKLSGGEQARVLIARLMRKPADLLMLDEPTNDLDIGSLEVLEQSLLDFPGALVLVTHDRYLLDRVSKKLLAIDGRGNAEYFADLAQWEASQAERAGQKSEKKNKDRDKKNSNKNSETPIKGASLSYREQKELKNMESSISKSDARLAQAKAALLDPTVAQDASELMKRQAELEKCQAACDLLYKRWEELEAKAGVADT